MSSVQILDHISALADPIRCRMLLLLEKHELTVSELCAVLQMPQSSVSRHLKTLADDDWVASRRDGTSRFYSMPADDLDAGATRLWPLIREQVAATSAAGQDDRRLRGVLARRPTLYSLARGLAHMKVPAHIISGDEDNNCLEPGLFIKRACPAARLTVVPATGHAVNIEEPDLFNRLTDEFLALVDSGRWRPRDPRSLNKSTMARK